MVSQSYEEGHSGVCFGRDGAGSFVGTLVWV